MHGRPAGAAHMLLGELGYRALWRATMAASFEKAPLNELIAGVLRLFGATPQALTTMTPRGWAAVSRDAGAIVWMPADRKGGAMLRLVGFPPQFAQDGVFAHGLAGCFEAYFDVCRIHGAVEITEHDSALGTATYFLRWG